MKKLCIVACAIMVCGSAIAGFVWFQTPGTTPPPADPPLIPYDSSFLIRFSADEDPFSDSSGVGTNVFDKGSGAAEPAWFGPTGTCKSYVYFDGGDWISAQTRCHFGFETQIMIEAWVMVNDLNKDGPLVLAKVDGTRHWGLRFLDTLDRWWWQNQDDVASTKTVYGETGYRTNTYKAWNHVVGIVDKARQCSIIWVNGRISKSNSWSLGAARVMPYNDELPNCFQIGRFVGLSPTFKGRIGLVGGYPRSASPSVPRQANPTYHTNVIASFWRESTNFGWTVYDYNNSTGTWVSAMGIFSFEFNIGTYYVDTSDRRRFATKVGGGGDPTWVSEGAAGPNAHSYFLLDGTADEMDHDGISKDFSQDDSFTFSAWINHLGSANPQAIIYQGNDDANNTNNISFMIEADNDLAFESWRADAGSTNHRLYVAYTNITTGSWTHVAAVVSGTTARLYVDGTMVTASTNASWPAVDNDYSFTDMTYGNGQYNNDTSANVFFNGGLDEVRTYGKSFTDDEVQSLWSSFTGIIN